MRWIFLINVARLLFKARELGIQVVCFTFWRSSEDQLKDFEAGLSRVKYGTHQTWLGIDFVLWEDLNLDGTVNRSELHWGFKPAYTTLGQYWESLGGVWGGRWKYPIDPYHFEWGPALLP